MPSTLTHVLDSLDARLPALASGSVVLAAVATLSGRSIADAVAAAALLLISAVVCQAVIHVFAAYHGRTQR